MFMNFGIGTSESTICDILIFLVIKMCHITSQIKLNSNNLEKLCHLHEALADAFCDMACYHPAVKHYKMQVCFYV